MKGLPNKGKKKIDTHRKKAPLVKTEFFKDDTNAKKFNKLSIIMSKYNMHECSDGSIVNMQMFKHIIRNRIEHLPMEEQELILHKADRFIQLKIRLGVYKKQVTATLGEDYDITLELRKSYIMELFGRHYNIDEVHKKMVEESGIPISHNAIKRFYIQYKVEIEKLQLEYEKDLGAIGISRKRSRLEMLDYMFRKTKQEYDKEQGQQMLPYSREMGKILEQARKEVEGEQIKLNIDGTINVTATIESAKNVEKLYADINFMNLLVSRVASRMRINPLLLNYQLAHSWYAKFTGIKRNDSLMDEVPDYPSKIILNWNELQQKAEVKERNQIERIQRFNDILDVEPIEEEQEKGNKVRELLKEKLRQKQAEIDVIKQKVINPK